MTKMHCVWFRSESLCLVQVREIDNLTSCWQRAQEVTYILQHHIPILDPRLGLCQGLIYLVCYPRSPLSPIILLYVPVSKPQIRSHDWHLDINLIQVPIYMPLGCQGHFEVAPSNSCTLLSYNCQCVRAIQKWHKFQTPPYAHQLGLIFTCNPDLEDYLHIPLLV
jgi:hypothetical protein